MSQIYLTVQPTIASLLKIGASRSRIARAVGCESQLVLCWLFGMQMNASRKPQWAQRLIDYAINLGMQRIYDAAFHGADEQHAAIEVIQSACVLLSSYEEHQGHEVYLG